jgi:hypothetical protein
MSWAAPASETQPNQAVVRAVLRRQKSLEKLYWRFNRPRLDVYARAAVRVIIYRLIAAAIAIAAITLFAFVGIVAGNVGYPRWMPLKDIHGPRLRSAETHAAPELARWILVFIVLGLILVAIPRAHRWIFRLTMLGGAALGYSQRHLPPFPRSAVAADITKWFASIASRILRPGTPTSITVAAIPLVIGAVAAYVLYRITYRLTWQTTDFIPRRPVNHNHSTFSSVNVVRRIAAVPIAAILLFSGLWMAESVRARLPGAHYLTLISWYSRPSVTAWVLAAAIIAWIICTPHPQGLRWLLILLLFGITAYAFSPRVYLLRVPAALPATAPGAFWALIMIYLLVIGFGFSLVAMVLDWPD